MQKLREEWRERVIITKADNDELFAVFSKILDKFYADRNEHYKKERQAREARQNASPKKYGFGQSPEEQRDMAHTLRKTFGDRRSYKLSDGNPDILGRHANWPGARFTRDINVNPIPQPALPTDRPVGRSPTQNHVKDKYVDYLGKKGYTNIRVNQRQVNSSGNVVGMNMPDTGADGPYTGDRINIEFERSTSPRGPEHERRIKANDPTSRIIIKKAD